MYVMSGTMTSTPNVAASGNIIPQSTAIIASPYSYSMRFMPISPSPPRGMMRSGVSITFGVRSPFAVRRSPRSSARRTANGKRRTDENSSARSRINPVQHAGIRNRLPQMRHAGDPRHHAFDAHAETGVRERAVFANVEIPLERLDRQVVLLDALQQQVVIVNALRSPDDLAIPLGRDHVQT